MPIVKDNTRRVIAVMQGRIAAGLSSAAKEGAEQYQEALRARTHATYPDGPFDPPHSSPGDFPDRETGQGHDSVDWSRATRTRRQAAFGVLGDAGEGPRGDHRIAGGMHLIWLMSQGRLGPTDIVTRSQYATALINAFRDRARKVNR